MSKKLLISQLIIVASVGVVSSLLPLTQPLSGLITGAAAFILIVIPHIFSLLKAIAGEKSVAKENRKYEDEIKTFLRPRLKKELASLGPIRSRKTRREIYQHFIDKNFPSLEEIKKNTLILLCLCHHYRRTKSVDLFQDIQHYAAVLSMFRVDDETKPTLAAYHFFFNLTKIAGSLAEIFDFSTLNQEELKNLLSNFIDEFSKEAPFIYIREELKQSEELRATLLQLIKEGELAAYNVTEEALDKLRKTLWEKQRMVGSYLVLGNRLEDVKPILRGHHNLGGSIMWSHVPGVKKPHMIVGYVIRPSKYFPSVSEFVKQEIKPHLKKQGHEFFFCVVPLDFINAEVCTYPESTKFSSLWLQGCYDAVNFFMKGYSDEITLWKVIGSSKIKVEELLSIIPFNIFVPKIVASERDFIIKHYKEIRTKLDVKTLRDWANIPHERIKEALLSFGRPNYNEVETEEVFRLRDPNRLTAEIIASRFTKISSVIVKNAKKFATAIS